MILSILPPYNYYTKLSVKADKIVVRQMSQIDKQIQKDYKFVLLDKYIPQSLAQKYNKISYNESLRHAINKKGIDCTNYKGISLADLNFVESLQVAFIPCYREALAFIGLIKEIKPTQIIISNHDPAADIFQEIASQMNITISVVTFFGGINSDVTERIKKSYKFVRDVNYHAPLRTSGFIELNVKLINIWSKIIRVIRGKKPFVGLAFYNPLKSIKSMLLFQKYYYPLLFDITKLKIKELLFSGVHIFLMKDVAKKNELLDKILENYKKQLIVLKQTKSTGQVEFDGQKITITNSIVNRLSKIALVEFKQLTDNIDLFESFIKKNNLKSFLGYCDSPWKMRLIIKLCQKHKIDNAVIMNGWLGDEFQQEAKTATTTLCYGESYIKNYFKDKKNVIITGNPLFDKVYKKRNFVKPNFPSQQIMVSSFSFSPVDINCHYSDNEKFLLDTFEVLNELKNEQNLKFETVLKLHPADPPEFYKWFLEKNGFSEIRIINSGDFQKLVSEFDLLIINYSTGLLETALMGIPVVFYHHNNQIFFEPFNGFKSLPTAFNKRELKSVLKKVFCDKKYAYSFTDLQVLKPFVGTVDGKAGKRIFNIITESLN